MKTCPFCPCIFETDTDFTLHMETFGYDKNKHYEKFSKVHSLYYTETTNLKSAPQQENF